MPKKILFVISIYLFIAGIFFSQESLTIEQKLAKVEDENFPCTFEFIDELEAEMKRAGYKDDALEFFVTKARRYAMESDEADVFSFVTPLNKSIEAMNKLRERVDIEKKKGNFEKWLYTAGQVIKFVVLPFYNKFSYIIESGHGAKILDSLVDGIKIIDEPASQLPDFNTRKHLLPSFAKVYEICGNCYKEIEDAVHARELYQRAVDIYIEFLGIESPEVAVIYNAIGITYAINYNYEKPLEYFSKSIEIFEKINDKNDVRPAAVYGNLGALYGNKCDYDRAIHYLKKGLEIEERLLLEDSLSKSETYVNMGYFYAIKNDFEKASEYYKKALAIQEKHWDGENAQIADTYIKLGGIQEDFNNLDAAKDYYTKALDIEEKLERSQNSTVAFIYQRLGEICYRQKNNEEGKKNFKQSVKICEEKFGKESAQYAEACYWLTLADFADNDFDAARKDWANTKRALQNSYLAYGYAIYKASEFLSVKGLPADFAQDILETYIAKIEEACTDIASLKTSIISAALPFYYATVHFAAEQKNAEKAFEYSEMLRSRGFLDQIGSSAAFRLQGVTDEDKAKIKDLQEKISYFRQFIDNSKNQSVLDEDLFAAANMLSNSEKEMKSLDAAIASRVPKYASLRNPKTATVKEAQKWCGKKRAVLEYVMCDTSNMSNNIKNLGIGSYCIVITAKNVSVVRLDSNFDYTAEIEKLIGSEKERTGLIGNPFKPISESRFESSRNNLYEHLIKPVLPLIEKSVGELVIVPDGNLSRLPFDVLRESEESKMLGEKYAVAFSPSISVSIVANEIKNNSDMVLAFCGALYDRDETGNKKAKSRGEYDFNLSPSNSEEYEYIKNLIKENGASVYLEKKFSQWPWKELKGTVAEVKKLKSDIFGKKKMDVKEGFEVSEDFIKKSSANGTLAKYSVLHFAGHGYFDSVIPETSCILFSEVSMKLEKVSSEDGYLTIPETAILNLNAEMLCLSACETGLGEIKGGDGMVGLSRAFMVAGAKNIGVSLWKVDDDAAADFMTKMYAYVKSGKTYIDAYKAAKDAMRKSEEFSHPYYWAPFVLYE